MGDGERLILYRQPLPPYTSHSVINLFILTTSEWSETRATAAVRCVRRQDWSRLHSIKATTASVAYNRPASDNIDRLLRGRKMPRTPSPPSSPTPLHPKQERTRGAQWVASADCGSTHASRSVSGSMLTTILRVAKVCSINRHPPSCSFYTPSYHFTRATAARV